VATVLCSRQGGELTDPNFLLLNQKVAPLTFIAEFRTPYAAVSKVEDHCGTRPAWRLGAPDCVIRFNCHTVLPFNCGKMRLMSVPHLRLNGQWAAMCSRSMLVHCPSGLGAAVAFLAAELPCGDGVFAKCTLEHAKAVHHFDGVMPHSFKCSRFSQYASELKLPHHSSTNGITIVH
jgi:hypothetical protein